MKIPVYEWETLPENPLTFEEAATIQREASVHRRVAGQLERRGEAEGAMYYSGMAEGMRDIADEYREHFKKGKKPPARNPAQGMKFAIEAAIDKYHPSTPESFIKTIAAELARNSGFDAARTKEAVRIAVARHRAKQKSYLAGSNPYKVRKLPGGGFRVTGPSGVHAYRTTKEKAEAQARLLRGIEHGMIPGRTNPPEKATLIYKRVLKIFASKAGMPHNCDDACKKAGHNYVHTFRHGSIWGLPNGDLFLH